MARALLADRPVLVLDEPTAQLDLATPILLRQSVASSAANRTLVWIAHHRADLASLHQIATVDQGQICVHPSPSC